MIINRPIGSLAIKKLRKKGLLQIEEAMGIFHQLKDTIENFNCFGETIQIFNGLGGIHHH